LEYSEDEVAILLIISRRYP